MAEDDERLFEQSVRGDDNALRILMDRYGDALTLFLNSFVHDPDMAEDLMIEAFSRMLSRHPRLRDGGLKPYLYKTARNLALRYEMERKRTLSLDVLTMEPEASDRVEEDLLSSEASTALYSSLALIPVQYREALYLVYIEGMSYDEAGAVMHRTRKQVDNLVQNGKRAMRELLEGKGLRHDFS